jgi:RNA polymerase sigma factor for flagellar operon FliA
MARPKRRDDLIHDHLHLVRTIARRVRRELDGRHDLDDLEGHGMEGLIQAAERFDPRRGVRFSTFAGYRIRGAMYDAVRQLGRQRRREQVAEAGSPDAVEAQRSDVPAVDCVLVDREHVVALRDALDKLPGRERRMIRAMYFGGRQLGAVGASLGLSVSWASRIHARALALLRGLLEAQPVAVAPRRALCRL